MKGKKKSQKQFKKKNPEPNQIIQNRTKKKSNKNKIRMWLIPFVTSRGHIHLRKPWLQQVGNFFARVASSKMKEIETTRRERRIEICRRNLQRSPPPPHMLHQIALKTAETSWSCNCPWMVIRPRHFCWDILSVSNFTYIMPNAKMARTNVCIFVC